MRVSGKRATDSRCTWPGDDTQPAGITRPKRTSRTGSSSAAARPPEVNSNHTMGSARRFAMTSPYDQPGRERRQQRPAGEVRTSDPGSRHPFAAYPDDHRLRCQVEPGEGVEQQEGQRGDVQRHHPRVAAQVEELLILLAALAD